MTRRRRSIKKLLLNWRVLLLIFVLVGAVATLSVKPISWGIDISGGVALVVQTEHSVGSSTMQAIVMSLQSRLNTFGVRDIRVQAEGSNIVLVKIANVSMTQAQQIKNLIQKQGVLYLEFDGKVFGTGKDIKVMRYGLDLQQGPTTWAVSFMISQASANEFAKIAANKVGWPVDIFLDPPVNSLMVVPPQVYNAMNSTYFNGRAGSAAPTLLQRIERGLNITVVKYTNQSARDIVSKAQKLNKRMIVLAGVPKNVSTGVSDIVSSKKLKIQVVSYPAPTGGDYYAYVKAILHLYGPYTLQFNPATGNTRNLQLTGSTPTKQQSLEQAKIIYTVLKSGSLPVKLNVTSMQFISPSLGSSFKKQAFYAGIIALLAVLLVVFFHYRRWKIAVPVASTSLFEVIIILAVAALIHWNLDLPSIAGIVAAIGTGVDQQIVITDELLGGIRAIGKGRLGIMQRIGRAMFIIFASAATTIVAMSFLFVYFVGTLRGFAFTTILGTLIGILVTRPAYAEIAKYLLSEE